MSAGRENDTLLGLAGNDILIGRCGRVIRRGPIRKPTL
jgi:Ca2+-binding RTX toxin-like protein